MSMGVQEEVYTKLSKIGCRCSCYRSNWKELSKDNWWSGFEYIIRRWGGFDDHLRSLDTVKKRMALLKSALKQMELSHKMLKKEEVKKLKKTPSIRLLGAMLDRLEGKYPGCFSVSYKWPPLSFFPSRLISKKRKAEEPAVREPSKRMKHDNIVVDVPVSHYTFDLNDPNPFARKKINPFRKSKDVDVISQDEDIAFSPPEKSPSSEKSKHDAATGVVKTVVQIPASPFRRTQNFEPAPKSPLLSLEDSNTGIEAEFEPEKSPEDIVFTNLVQSFMTSFTQLKATELKILERQFPSPIGFLARSSKEAMTLSFVKDYFTLPSGRCDSNLLQNIVNEISAIQQQNIQQPKAFLPKEKIAEPEQNTFQNNFEPKNYSVGFLHQSYEEEDVFEPNMKKPEKQLPKFERVDSLFIDEKLKEWKQIAQRTDLRPSEKKVLLEKNRKAREEYVKSEKTRFHKECLALGLKCKWDDLLDPEHNFKWLEFVTALSC